MTDARPDPDQRAPTLEEILQSRFPGRAPSASHRRLLEVAYRLLVRHGRRWITSGDMVAETGLSSASVCKALTRLIQRHGVFDLDDGAAVPRRYRFRPLPPPRQGADEPAPKKHNKRPASGNGFRDTMDNIARSTPRPPRKDTADLAQTAAATSRARPNAEAIDQHIAEHGVTQCPTMTAQGAVETEFDQLWWSNSHRGSDPLVVASG